MIGGRMGKDIWFGLLLELDLELGRDWHGGSIDETMDTILMEG